MPESAVADLRLESGEVVALVAPNGPLWLAGYRAVLAAGGVPLLLDADVPPAERNRWLARAGGSRTLSPHPGDGLRLSGPPSEGTAGVPRVMLCTSGSTGTPKIVTRTVASLAAEGRRYVEWAALTEADRIVLPLPLWHAYALGWAHAAEEAGAALLPMPPTALGACVRELEAGATVLALVPSTASLLSARGGRATATRLAMVGAGPVSNELDQRFRTAFGVGLARNYGSTETGALFAGPAGLPKGCIGAPMPGIEARIASAAPGEPGELRVRVDGGDWYDTGDIAVQTASGVCLVSRTSRAVRRGERWVAPEEIETVLLSHPAVVDTRVTGVSGPAGSTVLEAEVVGVSADGTDLGELRAHLSAHLSAYKVPERIRLVAEVPRGPSGKRLAPLSYTLGEPAALVAAAQAYKRSELVFTLLRLGVLDLLAGRPAGAAEIARELGLDPGVCEQLLRTAQELELILAASADPHDPGTDEGFDAVRPTVRLEEVRSRGRVVRERLGQVAVAGPDRGAGEAEGADAHGQVMDSLTARERVRLGLTLAGFRPGERLLEITSGPGRYTDAGARLLHPGAAAAALPSPEERFDVIVVAGAVHLPGLGSDLAALVTRLAPAGRLLIDDAFLPGIPAETRLDWLAYGGAAWPTVEALSAGLARAGLTVDRVIDTGTPPACLVVTTARAGCGCHSTTRHSCQRAAPT
jgi:hypothetical protein